MKRTRADSTRKEDARKHIRVSDPEDMFPGEEEDGKQLDLSKTSKGRSENPEIGTGMKDWRDVGEKVYDKAELDGLEREEFEPFNLAEERAMGQFDEQGAFTWKRRDLDEDGDAEWLAQVGDDIARGKEDVTGEDDEEKPAVEEGDVPKVLWEVIKHLQSGETARAALKRLKSNKVAFDELTDACALLLRQGLMDVYATAREDLAKRLRPLLWEYKVVGQEEIHGPFEGSEMQSWRDEGFFAVDSTEKCSVRIQGSKVWFQAEEIESFLLAPAPS